MVQEVLILHPLPSPLDAIEPVFSLLLVEVKLFGGYHLEVFRILLSKPSIDSTLASFEHLSLLHSLIEDVSFVFQQVPNDVLPVPSDLVALDVAFFFTTRA